MKVIYDFNLLWEVDVDQFAVVVKQKLHMNSYRIQSMFEWKIDFDNGKGEVKTKKLDGEGNKSKKKESLSEIIRMLIDRYGTNFSDANNVFHKFRECLNNDDAVKKATRWTPR